MARPYRTKRDERDVFRALAHPVRRKILQATLDEACSFAYLRKLTRRGEAAMAGHLRILREARVLIATRHGRAVLYRADQSALRTAARWLSSAAGRDVAA